RCTISSSRHAGLVTALPATASPCSPTIPRRPRSTLFPYTTLFRSHHIGSDLRLYIRSSAHYGSEGWGFESSRVRHLKTVEKPPEDRKSTRLNSSHVSSSYAVFCLKKRKHLTGESPTHQGRHQ